MRCAAGEWRLQWETSKEDEMSILDLYLFPNPMARDRASKSEALATGCVVGLPHYTVEEFIDQCLEEVGEFRPLVGGGFRRLLVSRAVRRAAGSTPTPGLVEEYAQATAQKMPCSPPPYPSPSRGRVWVEGVSMMHG